VTIALFVALAMTGRAWAAPQEHEHVHEHDNEHGREHDNGHDHDHDHESKFDHDHSGWELGLALGGVALLDESEVAFGLHLHLLRGVEALPGWRFGFGAEGVFDEHGHGNLSVVINYRIFGGLNASVAPGIVLMELADGWAPRFASHFEVAWEFEVGGIHLGPVVEYAWSSVDRHAMVGVHIGFML